VFGKKSTRERDPDERPHPYRPGFGHASYCQAILPSGIHCGRREVDPIHVVDPRNPYRHRG
jgi:hypothetical protein